jgi:hypothetical protein
MFQSAYSNEAASSVRRWCRTAERHQSVVAAVMTVTVTVSLDSRRGSSCRGSPGPGICHHLWRLSRPRNTFRPLLCPALPFITQRHPIIQLLRRAHHLTSHSPFSLSASLLFLAAPCSVLCALPLCPSAYLFNPPLALFKSPRSCSI